MIEDWVKKKISDFTYTVSGGTPNTSVKEYWENGTIPWINSGELSQHNFIKEPTTFISNSALNRSSAKLMPKGTVVIALTGATTGMSALLEIETSGNQSITGIIPSENHNSKFLLYLLQRDRQRILGFNIGSAQPHINKQIVDVLEFIMPNSIVEQTRIAEILSTADEAIEQTEKLIAKYQRIKTGLMQDLLTRGIDEHGNIRSKATHKFVVKNGIEVPEEWEVYSFKEVCSIIQDGTHFSPPIEESGDYMYLTSKNIREGYIDLSGVQFINVSEHQKIYKGCPVKEGDILLTKDGANTGNATINTFKEEFSLLSSVCLLRGEDNILNNEYLLYWILSKSGQRKIKDSMSGLAITRITLVIINAFKIPLPPINEQKIICNRIKAIYSYIDSLTKQLAKFNALKTGLMQDLLSGRVRVKI